MTVDVDPDAFQRAADSFAVANGVAGQTYQGLTDLLSGFGQRAGDDKTSDEFAAGYDDAAAEIVAGARELVDALAALARITSATAANHRDANSSSVYSANPPTYTGGQYDDLPDSSVTVPSFTPPSAVGGDDPDTPQFWDMVTDYLEGWTWPGADVDTLRRAGEAWTRFGQVLRQSLTPYLDSAASEIEAQRSPEVAIALDVTGELLMLLEQLEVHCADLGTACEEYATQVETVRDEVKGIMADLAIEIGVTAVASGILSFFSGGAAAVGGTALAAWRIKKFATRIVRAFSVMKAAVKTVAVARLLTVARKIPVLRKRFQRISEAANRARHERYLSELRRTMGRPHVQNPRLDSFMRRQWRPNASVGNGSTAAAVRHELATGTQVGGVWHSDKARQSITFLERWLRENPTATPGDRAAAENVLRDLRDALEGR